MAAVMVEVAQAQGVQIALILRVTKAKKLKMTAVSVADQIRALF